jgi:hypothetical protein
VQLREPLLRIVSFINNTNIVAMRNSEKRIKAAMLIVETSIAGCITLMRVTSDWNVYNEYEVVVTGSALSKHVRICLRVHAAHVAPIGTSDHSSPLRRKQNGVRCTAQSA